MPGLFSSKLLIQAYLLFCFSVMSLALPVPMYSIPPIPLIVAADQSTADEMGKWAQCNMQIGKTYIENDMKHW